MALLFGDSAMNYDAQRRRRTRQLGDVEEIAGAEAAAFSASGESTSRAIFIGVATGVITFALTRVLESIFPRRKS